ncbi:MAG: CPXCG motif-containing cysteine-rich protein [Ectothiorhodospiraceae bacterium]|nr:CPXCG motif-containing cysteine-rich protein [Ectothiorhodospiraceae bacterium]
MNELQENSIQCPYCGETIHVLIDTSVPQQDYIEDCQVCCRPINFAVSLDDDGDAMVSVSHEDE